MTDTPEQPTGEVRPAKRVREEPVNEPRGEDMESVVATEVARGEQPDTPIRDQRTDRRHGQP